MNIDKKFKTLYVIIIGLVVMMIGIVICFLAFINTKAAESATNPGTCLPIEKGGTGCDEEAMRKQYSFVYTTTKQDTGRTYNGQIVWGQRFTGTITAAIYVRVGTTLLSGDLTNLYIIAAGGWFSPNDYAGTKAFFPGNNPVDLDTSHYSSTLEVYSSSRVDFITSTNAARTNAPYDIWIDYIDGTLRN